MKKTILGAVSLLFLSATAFAQAPGGVTTGLKLWLKANAGVTVASGAVTQWNDQSGNGINFSNPAIGHQPTLGTSTSLLRNYNPTVNFDAINTHILRASSVLGTGSYTSASIFAVTAKTSTGRGSAFFEYTGTGSNAFQLNPGASDGKIYWDGDSTVRLSATPAVAVPGYFLTSGINGPSSQSLRRNGLQIASGSLPTSFSGKDSTAILGATLIGNVSGLYHFPGQINEVAIYTAPLSEPDIQKIQTYHAVKWGIGLDQSTPYNYVATDGTVIWDATVNSAYKNFIAAIGNDNAEALVQKQSRNAESAASIVTVGLGTLTLTNALNTGTFANDKSYLSWGSNTTAVTTQFNDLPSAYPTGQRLTQEWKVQTTNFSNATTPVSVRFDLSSSTGVTGVLGSVLSHFSLLIDTDGDGDFSTGTVLSIPATSYSAGTNTVTIANITQLTNGAVFTLLTVPSRTAPGGITAQLKLWLRADAGVTAVNGGISAWTDQSLFGLNFAQNTAALRPVYNADSNLINFNPVASFTGSKEIEAVNSSLYETSTNHIDASIFSISKVAAPGGSIFYNATLITAPQSIDIQPDSAGYIVWNAPYGESHLKAASWGTTNLNKATLLTCTRTSGNMQIFSNRTLAATGPANNSFNGAGHRARLGRGYTPTNYLTGSIPEIAVYESNLAGTDLQKIQSYGALKYGITLDQTTAYDYLATDGTVVWNATTNVTYNKNIAGIGRDDAESLTQKQSRSTNDFGIVAIGRGAVANSNPANNNTFASNISYLTWGSNSALGTTTASDLPAGGAYSLRLSQEWKVQATNFSTASEPVEMKFDLTGVSGITANTANHFRLLIDTDGDGDFTTGSPTVMAASGYGSNVVTVSNITALNSGAVFTLATVPVPVSPGGVTQGLKLWLRADTAVVATSGVSQWSDVSGNGNDFSQATGTAQPQYSTTTLLTNYNPGVAFSSGKLLQKTNGILGTGTYNVASIFSVSVPDSLRDAPIFAEETSVASNYLSLAAPANGTALWNGPQSVAISAAWGGTLKSPYLWSGVNGSNTQSLRRNGLQIASGTTTAASFSGNNNPSFIGHLNPAADYFSGLINEVIVYADSLSALDVQKIQTYNALKYGITLDQTVATDYVNPDGNIVWNGAANSAYNKNIAGIASENIEGLVQKQSRSVEASAMVTIGIGALANSNAANTATFATDRSYLVWGSNGTALTTQTTDLPANYASGQRLSQEWKAQTSNFNNAANPLSFRFDLSSVQSVSGGTVADFSLLIDTDGDGNFATGAIISIPATALSGDVLTVSGVTQLTNGAVFTLLTKPVTYAPGGVTAGLKLWLRSDMGIVNAGGINRWADQSFNGNHFSQASVLNQPTYNTGTGLQNFNPTVTFNAASNQSLIKTTGMLGNSAYTNVSLFAVSQNTSLNNGALVFEHTAPGTSGVFELSPGRTDGNAYWSGDQAIQIFAPWGGTTGMPYLWSGLNSSSAQSLNRNGLQIASGTNSTSFSGNSNMAMIGYNDAAYFDGNINEMIMYTSALSTTDIQKINTYNAIKWGLTLDQTTPANYLATDGTVVWDGTTNSTYKFNIAGIARDSVEALLQKQSRSVNNGSILSVGLTSIAASNAANTGSFANDKSYLTWGSTSAATTTQVTELPFALCDITERLTQEWKVQTTNFNNTTTPLQLKFDLNGITGVTGSTLASFNLLIDKDGDGDFTTGPVLSIAAAAYASNVVTFHNVTQLKNGTIFTLGTMKTTAGTGLAPFVPADGTSLTSSMSCYDNVQSMLYFLNPANPTTYIAAIRDPNLLIDPSKISVTVNTTSAYTDLGEGNSTSATRLMRRMLEVNCNNCFDTVANPTPQFTVRYLYSTPEKTAARSSETFNLAVIKAANSNSQPDTFYWFKANGTVASLLPTLTPQGIPATVGTTWPQNAFFNNGSVCDFSGIDRFSVFGGLWKTFDIPLAIGLTDFKGKAEANCMTRLSWTFAPESTCQSVDVRYSTDGRNFSDAAHVEVKDAGSFDYKQNSRTAYYQLRMLDIDGESSYSNIVRVNNDCGADNFSAVLYPNPATNEVTVSLAANGKRDVSIRVYDATGRLLTPAKYITVTDKTTFRLSTELWTSGMYKVIVRDENTGESISQTLMKK